MSCKREYNTGVHCKNKDQIVKDSVFNNSEIKASLFYDNKSCKIKKIKVLALLDDRSGNFETINDVAFTMGILGDTLIHGLVHSKNIKIDTINKTKILSFEKIFAQPFLDSLNFIELNTVAIVNHGEKKQLLKSESYFYKNSMALLGIENTYLDYKAFTDKSVHYKRLGLDKNVIDSIEVTVKVKNLDIDEIVDYTVVINDNRVLKFKQSILASYKNNIVEDQACVIYDVRKLNKNFLGFKLNLSALRLKEINAFKLSLNNKAQ
ncbi:MAG: hypothetical protein CR968_02905 [Flavobacteriia bacterium]|nr:MAG: hypothetical protein CR968_02905 [Flavobacteriia bacterium]